MMQFPPFDGAVIGKQVTQGPREAQFPRLLPVRSQFGAVWRPVEQSCTSVAPRRAVLRQ